MKKILLLSLFVCLVACFGACTKRDKLTNNTMVLQIEPVTPGMEFDNLNVGEEYELKAIVRNIKFEEIKEPVRWSVSSAELGSFTSPNSRNTAFRPDSSGEGKILLFCQGVTVSVDVTIS